MTIYISCDPDVMGGSPVISGTRLTVAAVQGRIRGGDTIEDLLADYPYIPLEAFLAALEFTLEP